ncbi:hypothetical protein [Phaeacidiphilus oryzae]|uniref:hypothetical protein n=1 Tax=Phaeacidiphilus oryzae TaxID=348818 RepID=UPI00068F4CD7|nr:hypothetical protein [Phaeacidiphilus oryzae]
MVLGRPHHLIRSDVEDVRFRPLDRWQADDHRDALADLFVECCPRTPGQEFAHREEFIDRLTADVRREGFAMQVAETANLGQPARLVGCVYGYPLGRDGSWWPPMDDGLPPEVEQLTAAGQVFGIVQFLVHPRFQRHGVAEHLHDQLLTGTRRGAMAAIVVDEADRPLLDACRAWGWQDIGRTPAPGETGEAAAGEVAGAGAVAADAEERTGRALVRPVEQTPGRPASPLPTSRINHEPAR